MIVDFIRTATSPYVMLSRWFVFKSLDPGIKIFEYSVKCDSVIKTMSMPLLNSIV